MSDIFYSMQYKLVVEIKEKSQYLESCESPEIQRSLPPGQPFWSKQPGQDIKMTKTEDPVTTTCGREI